MHANHIRVAQLSLLTVIAALGCHDDLPVLEHCHQAAGDQTCAELFGEERPFCVAPQAGCEAPDQFQGCVAIQPADECYSPCGDDTMSTVDSSCLGSAEDETSADTSTETGGDNGDGDGEGEGDPPPACGNGVVEGDEACDDGNATDDDECSNSCTLAACGDGILQAWNGETCDDGNTLSGDACAATCVLPGTIIWSQLVDGDTCSGAAVALADNGNIHVVSNCTMAGRTVKVFDSNGDSLWSTGTPLTPTGALSIAVTSEHATVVGGRIGNQGQVRCYDTTGSYVWSAIVPLAFSAISDVVVDGSDGVATVGGSGSDSFMYRYSADGHLEWFHHDVGGAWRAASNPGGTFWVLGNQVRKYTPAGDLDWASVNLVGWSQQDLATDHNDNVYVVERSNGESGFIVTKLDSAGSVEWLRLHDRPAFKEAGVGIAALPNGGALIAGWTNDDGTNVERDGLLSWYASDGTMLLDAVFDGEHNNDQDLLWEVAVSADGYAVAIGTHYDPGSGARALWLLKVAI